MMPLIIITITIFVHVNMRYSYFFNHIALRRIKILKLCSFYSIIYYNLNYRRAKRFFRFIKLLFQNFFGTLVKGITRMFLDQSRTNSCAYQCIALFKVIPCEKRLSQMQRSVLSSRLWERDGAQRSSKFYEPMAMQKNRISPLEN